MYRLLIVDDLPDIVDWLFLLFSNIPQLELEIYKAYSGADALDVLSSNRMDVILTDIRMPDINGLQLLEKIKETWPTSKVIFLTGYDEFEYVYTAIKHEGVSYLLKTEDDEEIVNAVRKAVAEIEESLKNEELINIAKQQINMTLPLLRNEFLVNLVYGNLLPKDFCQERFSELCIPLSTGTSVLPLLGFAENVDPHLSMRDKAELYYAVGLLIEKYLSVNFIAVNITIERTVLFWLLQPNPALTDKAEMHEGKIDWEWLSLFAKGSLESIQSSCSESLGITMSFAISTLPVPLAEIPEKYNLLKRILDNSRGLGFEMILTDRTFAQNEADKAAQDSISGFDIKVNMQKLDILKGYLDRCQKKEFFELFSTIVEPLKGVGSLNNNPALEVYYAVAALILAYINRCNLAESLAFKTNLYKLTRADEHESWNDAVCYIYQLAEYIFDIRENQSEKTVTDIVSRIQEYIGENLQNDLSLDRLAAMVHFNPSYLSRLFKQMTGCKLSDYICEMRIRKAKSLLETSNLKIQDIASEIGLDSPRYFRHFFKSLTKMSPQDYREACRRK